MLLVWLLIFATENIHTLFDFYRAKCLAIDMDLNYAVYIHHFYPSINLK